MSTQTLPIQAFAQAKREDVLRRLSLAIARSGGWILNRKTLSTESVQFSVEIPGRRVLDLYAGLLETGLEIAEPGHLALAEIWRCQKHLPPRSGELLSISLNIFFVETIRSTKNWPLEASASIRRN